MVDFKMKSRHRPNIFINNNKNYDHNPINNCGGQHDLLFYDISELILSRRTINENNKGKEKILAKIAHEFKTPITSIIGLVGLIKENLQSSILLSNKDFRKQNFFSESNNNNSLSETKNRVSSRTINNISKNNKNYDGNIKSYLNQLIIKTSKTSVL